MIDYEALSKKFTLRLQEFDNEKLDKWIEFDQFRDLLSRLISGETVKFVSSTISNAALSDARESIESNNCENSYALAA